MLSCTQYDLLTTELLICCQNFDRARKKFLQALVDNISNRFPEDDLLSAGAVLDHSMWPEDDETKMLYGDKEIVNLAKAVRLPVSFNLSAAECRLVCYFQAIFCHLSHVNKEV